MKIHILKNTFSNFHCQIEIQSGVRNLKDAKPAINFDLWQTRTETRVDHQMTSPRESGPSSTQRFPIFRTAQPPLPSFSYEPKMDMSHVTRQAERGSNDCILRACSRKSFLSIK
ncbi:hypothetical protein CEXT_752021 [Caerostris extrusa]|uniref:Uncharacterized protein n=1 Tax=Caerostris extrusa TaxID=172846 RepID=A0AAV4YAX5_CAEEX|nr:hypothetical protein CEXT_752021 [Caerostris extrusa]